MPGKHWTQSESAHLRELVGEAKSTSEMTIGTRTAHAIRNRAVRLNLIGDGVSRKPWTEEQKLLLQKMTGSGMKARRIAETGALPFSANAIQKQMQRMGLANLQASERQKKVKKFKGATLEKFHQFLHANRYSATPEQMAILWNEENEEKTTVLRVRYHLVELKINLPRKYVWHMAYSRLKRQRNKEARKVQLNDVA
jgi:hypothetical protein